jgi:hypothetical protein
MSKLTDQIIAIPTVCNPFPESDYWDGTMLLRAGFSVGVNRQRQASINYILKHAELLALFDWMLKGDMAKGFSDEFLEELKEQGLKLRGDK